MSGSTITTTIQGAVTLGSAHYAAPLTITSAGAILGNTGNASALDIPASGGGNVVVNDGTITGGQGVDVTATFGQQHIPPSIGFTAVYFGGGTLINAGTIAGGLPGHTPGTGTQGTAVQFGTQAGTLVVEAGAVFSGSVIANAGLADVLELSGTSTAALTGIGTQFQNFDDISFALDAAWTISGDTQGLTTSTTISGLSKDDAIVLTGFSATTETYVGGIGLELSNGTATDTLEITGSFTTADFAVTNDGTNTTITLDPLCYLRGTRILTPAGLRPIEQLAIGDEVFTWSGGRRRPRAIKWIARQNYQSRFISKNPARLPVRIHAGALGDGLPRRDLWVSPGHSLLLGETLVLARALVNGITVTQTAGECPALIEYFHIEFDSHDCIEAEGVWAESFADAPGLRAQFHNARDYAVLYPDAPTAEALILCAVRPEAGPRLEAAVLAVVERARARIVPGPLEGFIDLAGEYKVEGWARDLDHRDLPVHLAISLGSRIIGTVLARHPRDDLHAAGKGNCAFSFISPVALPAEQRSNLTVQRIAGGGTLPWSHGAAARDRNDISHMRHDAVRHSVR